MSPLYRQSFWIAPLIAFAGFVSYFLVFAKYPALRDFPWVNLPLVLAAALLAVAGLAISWKAASRIRRTFHVFGTVASLGLAGLLVLYVFVISTRMPDSSASRSRIEIAAPAPGFTLDDAEGNPVSLSDFRGKKVVLTFYRGFW
jgi:hypothetical protein